MKLTSISVRDYKCVRNSTQFEIGDVTCLVGKNESGKTSLLEAIYRLNPVVSEHRTFDVTDHYPRSDVEDYLQDLESGERKHAVVVEATYTLEKKEIAEVEEQFGKKVLPQNTVTLSKGYENTRYVGLQVDKIVATKKLVADSNLSPDLKKQAAKGTTLRELVTFLQARIDEGNDAVNTARQKANAITDEAAKQKAIADAKSQAPSPTLSELLKKITEIQKRGLSLYIWDSLLAKHEPSFLYFDEYYQMSGQVNIEELKKREAEHRLEDSDRPMLGLIELARLNLDQLISPKRTETLIAKLEGASNHLSKQVLKYWSQNKHLHVGFDVRPAQPGDPLGMQNGTNLWGRVHDSVHEVSTPLGTRSRGFIWFFSFLAWFSQQRKREGPLILLLDEPGLFLHAKAQGDLLRYIEEELKPHHQVIYSTHSPFMVDPHNFDRIRIVEDRSTEAGDIDDMPPDDRGTKVFREVLEAGEGSLFPLQGALGYDLSQSLFVGPNSLIVEGVSDLLYLQTISGVLEGKGRRGLSSKWTITPVGGSDKVPTFVALLGAQKRMKLATLIDIQQKDRQRIEQLYKKRLLRKKNVLTFGDFTGRGEADIEDMFDMGFYLKLVNSEFSGELKAPINEADLPQTDERILVRIEKYLKDNPLKKASFNHYRPARNFTENVASFTDELSTDCLDRFAEAIKALNSLL